MEINDSVSKIPSIGPVYIKKLEKLGIETVGNLINHIPTRYIDYSNITTTKHLRVGEVVTVQGEVSIIKNVISKRGVRMQITSFTDADGKVQVVWFNQPFLTKILYPGRKVSLAGKVGFFAGKVALVSPEYEIIYDEGTETKHTGKVVPVYPETAGLSSKWLRGKVKLAIKNLDFKKIEFLTVKTLSKYNLIPVGTAYSNIHSPEKIEDTIDAKRRLAFNELLSLQLKSLARKYEWERAKVAPSIVISKRELEKFYKTIPFSLTKSQNIAIDEILKDIKSKVPMNRLLQGDVGSGKTVVAATAAYVAIKNGFQVVFMAPTQILATQHFKTISSLFGKSIKTELITAATKKINKKANIFIGTHALLNKKELFNNVGLVVIDEQHRFGVNQRERLMKLNTHPHVLTMTATPIPRTIVQTVYGDLDISILKELPGGRIKITTWYVSEAKRESSYTWIKEQIKNGDQVFWVCPLIEESTVETMQEVKAVKKEFEKLKKIFKGLKLGLLHGRMKPREKDNVLTDFKRKKIDILVATPVVEVGIDIPNATIMVIEAAERFGLSQLHQLRGRVGRGDKKSYCLLFSDFGKTKRLSAMTTTHSGFELAELDLKLRGPGEIFGTAQSGFPELTIATWGDTELIKKTKELANEMLIENKSLKTYNLPI